MKDTWYSYGSIKYSPEQNLFLLENMDWLESGRWPSQHIESGYIGGAKSRAYKTEGYFVKAIVIIAELNVRLAACGEDGDLVVARYTDGYDEIDLSYRYGGDYWEVISRINSALNYCRGVRRKRQSYQQYKRGRRSYDKKKADR